MWCVEFWSEKINDRLHHLQRLFVAIACSLSEKSLEYRYFCEVLWSKWRHYSVDVPTSTNWDKCCGELMNLAWEKIESVRETESAPIKGRLLDSFKQSCSYDEQTKVICLCRGNCVSRVDALYMSGWNCLMSCFNGTVLNMFGVWVRCVIVFWEICPEGERLSCHYVKINSLCSSGTLLLCLCLCLRLSVFLSVRPSACLFVCLSVCQSVRLCLSVCLSLPPSVRPSVCLSFSPTLSLSLSLSLSPRSLSVSVSVFLSALLLQPRWPIG